MESEYSDYIDFKKWKFGELSDDLRESYMHELSTCRLGSGAKIFEMGFGQGSFLKWSKERGFVPFGTEINSDLVELALKNNYDVCHSSEDIKAKIANQKFNVVVAFDVLEHLTKNEIIEFLQFAKQILAPGGQVVVRFPNGQSPFGRYYQYGDPTHVSVLSRVIIEQLALRVGFKVLIAKNSARPLGNTFLKKFKRTCIYKLRDWIGTLVCMIFWGEVYPMDPNITMVLTEK
jgi:2-polyprenyl-3-methyl-5-hydroxy-6-metoxy-1,4-benzoquinol methylase